MPVDPDVPRKPLDPRELARDLRALRNRLISYDSEDLVAIGAALQLMPENAHHLLRLQAVAHAAAVAQHLEPVARRIDPIELEQLLNAPPLSEGRIADLEDPLENQFCESFTFIDGSYAILSGLHPESPYVLRRLCEALFVNPPSELAAMRKEAQAVVWATLALSNEVVRRAGLLRARDVPSPDRETIIVPSAERLEKLKQAVTFDFAQLKGLLSPLKLTPNVLDPLLTGALRLEDFAREEGGLKEHPLLPVKDGLVVAEPGSLARALLHRLVAISVAHRCHYELARTFGTRAFENIAAAFERIENPPLFDKYLSEWSRDSCWNLGWFQTDTDKITMVLLLTDSLAKRTERFITLRPKPVLTKIRRSKLFRSLSSSRRILLVVVYQHIARPAMIALRLETGVASKNLFMSAAELEVISHVAAENPLALWKYAQAREEFREHCKVIAPGVLEEFQAYWQNGERLSNMRQRDGALVIKPGGAYLLRRQAQGVRDTHGVPSWEGGTIEVERTSKDHRIPVYSPSGGITQAVWFLLEGLPIAIWVTPLHPVERDQNWLHWTTQYTFCYAVAFWLWQATPSLAPLLLGTPTRPSVIRVQIDDTRFPLGTAADSEHASPAEDPLRVEVAPELSQINIQLLPTFEQLLAARDNRADRELLRALAAGLLELTGEQPVAGQIQQIVEHHAPLGHKKWLLWRHTAASPELDPRLLPDVRQIQRFDVHKVEEEMSTAVTAQLALTPGIVPIERRREVLLNASTFYFQELARLVASLCPKRLIEILVTQDEAIVRRRALDNSTIAGRRAFEVFNKTLIDEVGEDVIPLNATAAASRFLIEFVAAQPPRGTRRFSIEIYDRLLALAQRLIQTGYDCDSLHYRLADVLVGVTPSGDLLHAVPRHLRATERYIPVLAAGEIARIGDQNSEEATLPPGLANEEESKERDQVTRAEFGLSITEIASFVDVLILVGMEQEQPATSLSEPDLARRIAHELGWDNVLTRRAVDLLSLGPREDFMTVERPFRKEDVYPWRMNRKLSYVRRPLLRTMDADGPVIIWGRRHLSTVINHLVYLCMTGRLQAQNPRMKQFLSHRQQVLGRWFNDVVAAVLQKRGDFRVMTRIDRIGCERARGSLGDLGDIDVLALELPEKRAWSIECKHLNVARTPYELRSELERLFEGKDGSSPTVVRHLRRTEWLRAHLSQLLTGAGIVHDAGWRVEPIIVVEREMISSHWQRSPVPIIALHQLKDHLALGRPLMSLIEESRRF